MHTSRFRVLAFIIAMLAWAPALTLTAGSTAAAAQATQPSVADLAEQARQRPGLDPAAEEVPPPRPDRQKSAGKDAGAEPSGTPPPTTAPAVGTGFLAWLAAGTDMSPYAWDMIVTAFLGAAGSAAYFFAVLSGFIQPRETLLRHLTKPIEIVSEQEYERSIRWLRWIAFVFFGAVVACVFQLAQSPSFAPVQAFVMGATWPTVVNRMLTGGTPTDPRRVMTGKAERKEDLRPDDIQT